MAVSSTLFFPIADLHCTLTRHTCSCSKSECENLTGSCLCLGGAQCNIWIALLRNWFYWHLSRSQEFRIECGHVKYFFSSSLVHLGAGSPSGFLFSCLQINMLLVSLYFHCPIASSSPFQCWFLWIAGCPKIGSGTGVDLVNLHFMLLVDHSSQEWIELNARTSWRMSLKLSFLCIHRQPSTTVWQNSAGNAQLIHRGGHRGFGWLASCATVSWTRTRPAVCLSAHPLPCCSWNLLETNQSRKSNT